MPCVTGGEWASECSDLYHGRSWRRRDPLQKCAVSSYSSCFYSRQPPPIFRHEHHFCSIPLLPVLQRSRLSRPQMKIIARIRIWHRRTFRSSHCRGMKQRAPLMNHKRENYTVRKTWILPFLLLVRMLCFEATVDYATSRSLRTGIGIPNTGRKRWSQQLLSSKNPDTFKYPVYICLLLERVAFTNAASMIFATCSGVEPRHD